MTRLYGDRWKIIGGSPLGQGGQSEVFRAIDIRGEHTGEYALKRIRNPKRQVRFENEIEAIGRLQHPNIVRLVDHSALARPRGSTEPPFLVMPLAHGGDLGAPERAASYKANLDSTLIVARQLAQGLAFAHANGVIHRDVKPGNVLFRGIGHDVWISDFGICLLREAPPVTPSDEVMGPRDFIAPELEGGGRLDATSAADIYALGKVIYYMISGGLVLPRERLEEARYKDVFADGQRYQLLRLLLAKMVSELATRLKTMDEVIKELDRIEAWERKAPLLALTSTGLDAVARLRRNCIAKSQARQVNAARREETAQLLNAVTDNLLGWVRSELTEIASQFGDGTALRMEVRNVTGPTNDNSLSVQTSEGGGYRIIGGVELSLREAGDSFHVRHVLQVLLCRECKVTVNPVISGTPGVPDPVEPPQDIQLALIPMYRRTADPETPRASQIRGYLSRREKIGTNRGQLQIGSRPYRRQAPNVEFVRVEPVMASFHYDTAQVAPFRLSEWPARQEELRAGLTTAVDSFLELVERGIPRIGR